MSQPQQARVTAIESLVRLRGAMVTFGERASAALGDADGEAQRAIMKLRLEDGPRWAKRLRERQDAFVAARSELIRKQASFSDDSPTCIEQRKAMEKAKRAVDEAQEKVQRVKALLVELERRYTIYKGHVAGMNDIVSRTVPLAAARLERAVAALESYRSIGPARAEGAEGAEGVS